MLLAHRGGSGIGPENTMIAFERGLAAGADGLELDVHLSRDGEVVVVHDPTVDRTTSGTGAVESFTAGELARLDAGWRFANAAGFPDRGRGIGVPRLRDVLARFTGVPMTIEIKVPGRAVAEAVTGVIRRADAIDRVVIGSFYDSALQAARQLEPRLATSAAHDEGMRFLAMWRCGLGRWTRVRWDLVQTPERIRRVRIVSPALVRFAHARGLAVQVWTVDAADDARRLLDWGVDGLISDRPDLLAPVIQEYRRRI